mgnify:CR=1 FL=1
MKTVDPRNQDILVYVNGELKPRAEARVSVFDSVVQGGDAVWEGLRVYNGRIAAFSAHLARLQNSAKALAFAVPLGILLPLNEQVAERLGVSTDEVEQVDAALARIRRKLQALGCDPALLRAVRGAGYLLAVAGGAR